MAAVDRGRYKVRLTTDELDILGRRAWEPPEPGEATGELLVGALRAAGVALDAPVPAWVGDTLGVVAYPALRIVVETLAGGERLEHHLWGVPAQAVSGVPTGPGTAELGLVEYEMVPWVIAQIVGLGRRPEDPDAAPVRLPASALEAIERNAGTGRPAGDTVRALGMLFDPAVMATLAEVFAQHRMSWRASSLWTDASGRSRSGGVMVLDAGAAGLWFAGLSGGESPDPAVTLRRTGAGDVWRAVVDLLPNEQ